MAREQDVGWAEPSSCWPFPSPFCWGWLYINCTNFFRPLVISFWQREALPLFLSLFPSYFLSLQLLHTNPVAAHVCSYLDLLLSLSFRDNLVAPSPPLSSSRHVQNDNCAIFLSHSLACPVARRGRKMISLLRWSICSFFAFSSSLILQIRTKTEIILQSLCY